MATTTEKQTSNGKAGRDSIAVDNPATGQVVANLEAATPEDVAAMADRARTAQPAWQAAGFAERAKILSRFQKWMCDNADRIIDTEMSESGKTREDVTIELSLVVASAGFWAKNAAKYLKDEKVKTSSPFLLGRKTLVRYEPLGVAAIIGPWNYPLANNIGDVFPALAAGNTVILKPSSVTPLTSLLMEEGLRECGIPDNVFQVLVGRGAIGEYLVDHADMVMFTGSTEVGKTVMKRAADTLTPVSLELGGKDPMIVLADADIDRAANAAVFWSMQNAGQTCISVERCYVEEPIHDRFIEMVAERTQKLRQGVPGGYGSVEVGSFINPPQIDIVEAHVNDAVSKGARVLSGGKRLQAAGTFFEPTVLADVDHTMECMTEETFGPTLPIMKVRDADEAIKMANDSPYGLQASVFTKDMAKGEAVARKLQSGAVVVNDCVANYMALEAPMGGWKTSGIGVRHGPDGIRKYTHRQTILLSKWVMKKDLYMFPYSKRTSELLLKLTKFLYGRGDRG
ncbi:MAG TPA: succinic semialdehyde dehydrogenase [Solirubrobacteraceae bacterium]|jgi:acyl-CoA reductase-like NAD-dependent aldehyde dehydrogenase|nr:succinic semialdehyde dehydrogenase [Solirubrobacteraceae bacterium]